MHWWQQTREIVKLAQKNLWRWRWRSAAVAGLVALAFGVYILYGGLLLVNRQSGLASIAPLRLPADMIIIPDGDRLGRSPGSFPPPQYNRRILEYGEEAVAVTALSRLGEVEFLGIRINSRFFPLDQMRIEGDKLTQKNAILLPQTMADAKGVKIGDRLTLTAVDKTDGRRRQGEFIVAGTFMADYDLAQPLARIEDLLALKSSANTNRYLIRKVPECEMVHLVQWMGSIFPKATLLTSDSSLQLGRKIAKEIYQPGYLVLAMIYLFMGIGVLSVTLITLLERRRELAVLKTLGVSNGQVAAIMILEQGASGIVGLGAGGLISQVLGRKLAWFAKLTPSSVNGLAWQGIAWTIAVMYLAAYLPTLTAKVATVNQLLFARTIPIRTKKINRLVNAYTWLVEREEREGVRILRLDVVDGQLQGFRLKDAGETVKKGEVVATQERMFGLEYREWCSPVDGKIIEYNVFTGDMVFKPTKPQPKVQYESLSFSDTGSITASTALATDGFRQFRARQRRANQVLGAKKGQVVNVLPLQTTWSDRLRWAMAGRGAWVVGLAVVALLFSLRMSMESRSLPVTGYQTGSLPYPLYKEWETDLKELVADYPALARLEEIGQSNQARSVYLLTVTDLNVGVAEDKPALMMLAGQHGNEAMGWKVGLGTVKHLLTQRDSDPIIADLLRRKTLYAVLMVNPDGYEIFNTVNSTQRRNARPGVDTDKDFRSDEDPTIIPHGFEQRARVTFTPEWLAEHVDNPFVTGWSERDADNRYLHIKSYQYWGLYGSDGQLYRQVDHDGDSREGEDGYDGIDPNRNWEYQWGWSDQVMSASYGGTEPWSEREVRAVRDFVLDHPNIKQFLDLHSGVETILTPWAYTLDTTPDLDRLGEVARQIRPDDSVVVQRASQLYLHYGVSLDWFYSRGIPSMTFEVYGGPYERFTRESDGSYMYGTILENKYNPPTAVEQEKVIQRWVPTVIKWFMATP